MSRAIIAAACACLVFSGAGCGNDGGDGRTASSAEIAAQVKRYYAALDGGDGKAACSLLTSQAARGFEAVVTGRVSADCAANIERLSRVSVLRGAPQVTHVESTASQATAHLTFDDPPFESDVALVRERGVWRLAQIPATVESATGVTGP